jgi:putative transposase
MRTFAYRLYPNQEQRRCLDACLYESRSIYNEMVERENQQYQQTGKFLSKYDLTASFKGRGGTYVPASTVQCLADRLDKALRAFLAHRDQDWGFPRFKSANQWHSIQLRQLGIDFTPTGRLLKVPAKLGSAIKIKMHRPLTGTPKTCYLVKRADGHWYALIVCDLPAAGDLSHPDDERGGIGLDVGLKVFLADSDGNTVENPRFFRTSQASLPQAAPLVRSQKGQPPPWQDGAEYRTDTSENRTPAPRLSFQDRETIRRCVFDNRCRGSEHARAGP